MKGGYINVDCTGLDLSSSDPQTIDGIWDKAVEAMKVNKPIMAYGCDYNGAVMSPVECFGWYIATDEIVIVGATLHVHIKDDDSCTVLDVAA